MPITENDLTGLRDGNVVSASGDKIGSIGQIYLDDQTGEPTFVTVNTGLFGMKQSFVPLQGARVQDGDVIVDYDKDTVKDAPRIDDDGSLTPEEEDQLYSYYGLGGVGTTTDGYDTTGYDAGTATDTGYAAGTTTDAGYAGTTSDTGYADRGTTTGTGYTDTGTTTGTGYADTGADRTQGVAAGTDRGTVGADNATTGSEEQANVGTTREVGRARLRKYVATDNVTQPEPVDSDVDADRPDRRDT
jgi:sporulation protein YlmC with PRC-barrel domain